MKRCLKWVAMGATLLLALPGGRPALADGPLQQGGDNSSCLACHGNPSLTYEFPSGDVWPLYVAEDLFGGSVHGRQGLACTACHTDIEGYPHPSLTASSSRAYQLEHYTTCRQCHDDVYMMSLDSVHARELAAGNRNAPVCSDCHGAHYATPPDQPRTNIPQTCSKCHAAIHDEYLNSVHGQALIDENNRDVPTCIDCHGVHNQEDPRTTQFRLHSPELCATCHADELLMSRYDISTNVFDTYVADFHGTTVTLFERQSPDLPTNKPVCYDCHGVHTMKRVDDPESQVFRENLLETCRKCHPDASESFPASWLSHYEPNRERYPLVYFVDLFYKIFIPAVLGFMVVYVSIDTSGRLVRRFRRQDRGEGS
jgi:hypothetical protein